MPYVGDHHTGSDAYVERVDSVEGELTKLVHSQLWRNYYLMVSRIRDDSGDAVALGPQDQDHIALRAMLQPKLVQRSQIAMTKTRTRILIHVSKPDFIVIVFVEVIRKWFFRFCKVATTTILQMRRDDFEVERWLLCVVEEMREKLYRVERDELERTRANLRDGRRESTRVALIDDYTIDANEHRAAKDTPKVLRVCHLVEEQIELALNRLLLLVFLLFLAIHVDNVFHTSYVCVGDFVTLEDGVLVIAPATEFG